MRGAALGGAGAGYRAPLKAEVTAAYSAFSLRLKIERPGLPGVVVEEMRRGRACDKGRLGLFPSDGSHVVSVGAIRLSRRDETFGRWVQSQRIAFHLRGALKMV